MFGDNIKWQMQVERLKQIIEFVRKNIPEVPFYKAALEFALIKKKQEQEKFHEYLKENVDMEAALVTYLYDVFPVYKKAILTKNVKDLKQEDWEDIRVGMETGLEIIRRFLAKVIKENIQILPENYKPKEGEEVVEINGITIRLRSF